VRVCSRRDGTRLELANIHHGPQLALVLQLRATELFGDGAQALDAEFFRSALGPGAPSILRPHQGLVLAVALVCALAFGMIGLARRSSLPPVVYGEDDAIAPHGLRRSTVDIAAFMEREVMPFARQALAPIVGGPDNVTCETCHGADARQRNWRMPGVRALPEPELRLAGLERARLWLDPQIRNAVYGYLAQEDTQSIASYMRQVVMPGMARVMHRPAYDFAKSYGYNRSRAAVGCYHCHLVE
jgi:cytochrome c553